MQKHSLVNVIDAEIIQFVVFYTRIIEIMWKFTVTAIIKPVLILLTYVFLEWVLPKLDLVS